MTKCPKCGYEHPNVITECTKCGIVFEKYRLRQRQTRTDGSIAVKKTSTDYRDNTSCSVLRGIFFSFHPPVTAIQFAGRSLLFLAVFIIGMKFIFTPIESNASGKSFLHLINLPFHEAGHVFFRPFGQFMMMLGGSITQLLIPFICFLFFLLKKRDPYAASICLWWFGENFIDLAPYINDARKLSMPLIGGVTGQDVENFHDWEFILRRLNCLKYDQVLAVVSQTIGILLMLVALLWGAFLLFQQLRILRADNLSE